MKVLEVLGKSTDYLASKGVESPRLQVEWLLAHLLQLKRIQVYMNHERELTPVEEDQLRQWVIRRGKREPLQHILGTAPFMELTLEVNRDVLVPRPETESLADVARAWMKQQAPDGRVLDLGTGSGCLLLAVLQACPGTTGVGVDVSSQALAVAVRNGNRAGLADRLEWRQGDFLGALSPGETFHLILSNPPYIPTAEVETLQPEVRDHDPRLALDGGEDGLDFYRRLAAEAPAFLAPGGCLMAEFGDGQGPEIRSLLQQHGWVDVVCHPDLSGTERFFVARNGGA